MAHRDSGGEGAQRVEGWGWGVEVEGEIARCSCVISELVVKVMWMNSNGKYIHNAFGLINHQTEMQLQSE